MSSWDIAVEKQDKKIGRILGFFRRWLINADIVLHVIAAVLLLLASIFIFFFSIPNLINPSISSIIRLVDDVLLALIILELFWTVIRFLSKQQFIIVPFLSIGIIAAIRRILLLEAQASTMTSIPVEKTLEIGITAAIALVLIIAYYLAAKADKLIQSSK